MTCIHAAQGRDGTPHYVTNTPASSFVWDGRTSHIEFLHAGYGEPDAVALPAPDPTISGGTLAVLDAFARACTVWCEATDGAPAAADLFTPHLTYFDGNRSIGWTGRTDRPARIHTGYFDPNCIDSDDFVADVTVPVGAVVGDSASTVAAAYRRWCESVPSQRGRYRECTA